MSGLSLNVGCFVSPNSTTLRKAKTMVKLAIMRYISVIFIMNGRNFSKSRKTVGASILTMTAGTICARLFSTLWSASKSSHLRGDFLNNQ